MNIYDNNKVVGLFRSYVEANDAVADLEDEGFAADQISVVAQESSLADMTGMDEDVTDGASTGAVVGGLAGLLAGIAAVTVPGLGVVLTAGSIASAAVLTAGGAAAGGLLGALIDWGVPDKEAGLYAEGVKRGGILVAVETEDEDEAETARDILHEHDVVDVKKKSAEWTEEGWEGYSEEDDWDETYPRI